MAEMEPKPVFDTFTYLSQESRALRRQIVSNEAGSAQLESFFNLVKALSKYPVKKCPETHSRKKMWQTCHSVIELLVEEDMLAQETMLSWVDSEAVTASSVSVEVATIKDALTVLREFEVTGMSIESTPLRFALPLANIFLDGFFFHTGEAEADEILDRFWKIVNARPFDHGALFGLSQMMLIRKELFGSFNDTIFHRASQELRHIIQRDIPSRVESQSSLQTTTDLEVLQKCRQALSNLLCAKMKKFELQLIESDISEVIEGFRELIQGSDQHEVWRYKVHLSTALRLRFRHMESLQYLEEALDLALEATLDASQPAEALALCMDAHAKAIYVRYEFFQTQELLDPMIELSSKVVAFRLEASDASHCLPLNLVNLANSLCFRYAKLGEPTDIKIAVSCAKHALECLPHNPNQLDLRRSVCLQSLGDIHLRMHWRSSGLEILDQAIEYYIQCEEQNDPDHTFFLYGASQRNYALVQKGFRRNETRWVLEALKRKTDWVVAHQGDNTILKLSPIDNINWQLIPGQATPFIGRRQQSVEERDKWIDMGINYLEQAMQQRSLASRFIYVCEALGIGLSEKAMYSRELSDFEQANEHWRKSIALFTDEQFTNNLRTKLSFAGGLYVAAEVGNTVQFAQEGLRLLEPIIDDMRLSYWLRVRASVMAARFHFNLLGDPIQAAMALIKAHDLIPSATSGMSRPDQLQLLEEEFDIPAWMLVLSLSQGTPQTSLELLERGRNIFWDGLLKQKQLFTSGSSAFGSGSGVYQTLRRLSVNSDNGNQLQTNLSSTDSAADSSFSAGNVNLIEDGVNGPVVFINIHTLRSDALILTNKEVFSLDLPELKEADCISYYQKYQKAQSVLINQQSKAEASEIMSDVFKWLWVTAAQRILQRLDILDRRSQDGSTASHKIWWATTKWISVLPIHAAGDHLACKMTGEPESVFDRVISSYIPTIKILRFLRQRLKHFASSPLPDPTLALLVAMPSTPRQDDLPLAEREVQTVRSNLERKFKINLSICPKSPSIVEALGNCMLAHFACHTEVDARDPSKTRLQLVDWDKDAALTVDRLVQMELSSCRMTYLSSCNTARDWSIRENSMHIAVGFLMAGVPYVIGTLWKVEDSVSEEVATQFYQKLDLAKSIDNVSSAARQLHEVLGELRERGAYLVDWAPYAHFGA
jgi:tetratricopeptide (TPR) repeat protein